jgi:hypothetical protein
MLGLGCRPACGSLQSEFRRTRDAEAYEVDTPQAARGREQRRSGLRRGRAYLYVIHMGLTQTSSPSACSPRT